MSAQPSKMKSLIIYAKPAGHESSASRSGIVGRTLGAALTGYLLQVGSTDVVEVRESSHSW